ncbi:MAG: YopX family protein [Endomicrobium sp.]|nr:YopX family protein [Endomicrobium sp.]
MREIKFRGKTDEGWVFGYLGIDVDDVLQIERKNYEGAIELIEVIDDTVGEYIGIRDKKGKKIYEGDILEVLFVDSERGIREIVNTCVVEFDEDRAAFGIRTYVDDNDKEGVFTGFFDNIIAEFLVIGNIHDNPEFLKKNKQKGNKKRLKT